MIEVIAIVLHVFTLASTPAKARVAVAQNPIWSWNNRDRIDARLNSRHDVDRARVASAPASNAFQEQIDGRVSPELFLPFEIFDRLMGGISADAKHRENTRRVLDPKLREFGVKPEAFWKLLAVNANKYGQLAAKRGRHGAAHSGASSQSVTVLIDRETCRARVEALTAFRSAFGADLDRLLYTVVAPQMRYSGSGTSGDRAAELLYLAEGCP